jgi:hypothetical protein
MTLTGINSKGVVYMARRKTWVSDTFHVFDRVVTMGSTLPDGTTAEKNYVWLSDWQLENINSNYLLPIDLDTYRKLRNQIAKILMPLLQVWLYASRAAGRFEKRYPELCEILDIVCHKHLSLIRRQLEPSLIELTEHGYLGAWAIHPTVDGREFKLVATHGDKFYHDQKLRAAAPATGQIERAAVPLLKELTDRGINEVQANRLLRALPSDQPIQDQLEYGDYLIWKSRSTIKNGPGFYVYLLRQNIPAAGGVRNFQPPEDAPAQRRAGGAGIPSPPPAGRPVSGVLPGQSPGASEGDGRRCQAGAAARENPRRSPPVGPPAFGHHRRDCQPSTGAGSAHPAEPADGRRVCRAESPGIALRVRLETAGLAAGRLR